jgi:tRNA (cmo5U34)-methyltransferase
MSSQPTPFDQAHANAYDERFSRLAPLRDALHLLIGAVFFDLPEDAKVLCVGVGTGQEVIALAARFPKWEFALVDPSNDMLKVCRRNTDAHGITSRCQFHEGYLDSFSPAAPFDAATSLLVSQFILEPSARARFFQSIAERLKPRGLLATADLASDLTSTSSQGLLEVWLRLMQETGLKPDQFDRVRATYKNDLAILPEDAVHTLVASNGFENPILFFKAGLIHAWYARRT